MSVHNDRAAAAMEIEIPDCPICYTSIENDRLTTTCNHLFHQACLGRWITANRANPTCPYCRTIQDNDWVVLNFGAAPAAAPAPGAGMAQRALGLRAVADLIFAQQDRDNNPFVNANVNEHEIDQNRFPVVPALPLHAFADGLRDVLREENGQLPIAPANMDEAHPMMRVEVEIVEMGEEELAQRVAAEEGLVVRVDQAEDPRGIFAADAEEAEHLEDVD